MREVLLACGILGGLMALGAAGRFASWEVLVQWGAILLTTGLAFGIPCAVRYHQLLHRALAPRGVLSPRWLWSPLEEHHKLLDEERGPVLAWCYAGAAGWGIAILGCVLLGLAVMVGV